MTVFRKTEEGGIELPPLPPRTVTPEKLRALADRLGLREQAPIVTFKNGSTISVEQIVVVNGSLGGQSTFGNAELRAAYAMALYGSQRTAQPKGDPAKFGEDAPW